MSNAPKAAACGPTRYYDDSELPWADRRRSYRPDYSPKKGPRDVSLSLAPAHWAILDRLAKARNIPRGALAREILETELAKAEENRE